MFFIRYKCSQCGNGFKALRMFTDSETTRKCPRCGTDGVPPVDEDLKALQFEEKQICSFG